MIKRAMIWFVLSSSFDLNDGEAGDILNLPGPQEAVTTNMHSRIPDLSSQGRKWSILYLVKHGIDRSHQSKSSTA